MTCTYDECKDWTHEVFDHYDTEWHMVNESYIVQEQVPDNRSNKIIGVTINGDYYPAKFTGCLSFYNDTLSTWLVPCGEHNFDEYPTCQEYEIEKKACFETYFGDGQ